VVKNIVSRAKLIDLHARLIDEFERAKQSGRLFSGGGQVSGHLNCFPGEQSRFAYEALRASGVLDLIRTLSPKSVREPYVGCNFNLPNSVKQHYHTDLPFTREFIIANITVVDTTLANGAIDMIPGSHKKFYPYWKFALERPYRAHRRIESESGDVLI